MVKASLTGSIIGNLLLVLGLSVLVGGLRNGRQTFSREIAGSNAALLVLAAIGLLSRPSWPSAASTSAGSVVEDSVLVSVFLIAGYILSLIYQFDEPDQHARRPRTPRCDLEGPRWSGREAAVVLVGAAVLLAILSEILVGAIEPVVDTIGLTDVLRRRRSSCR